jgi:hypothetical protein
MTITGQTEVCGSLKFGTETRCGRPKGHSGQHKIRERDTEGWGGGKTRLSVAPKIRPLPAGKQLAPQQVPPLGKWEHVPGQVAMDLFSDDPDALVDPADPAA